MVNIKNRYSHNLIFLFLFSFLFTLSANAQDKANGKKIFEQNCTACHKLGEKLVGPNLIGVKSRWNNDLKKISAFVHNPSKFIETDPYVKKLFAETGTVMTPQTLTDKEVADVIEYVNDPGPIGGTTASTQGTAGNAGNNAGTEVTNTGSGLLGLPYGLSVFLLVIVFLLLLLIALTLYRVRRHLRKMQWEREHPGEQMPSAATEYRPGWWTRQWDYWRSTINPTMFVMTIVGILVLLYCISLYRKAQDLGTQIGYAPEQPIKFNHKIHAGQYGIQCQYCHTGVEKAKNANIPSLSTCMNCHNYIKEGPQYGKVEIGKLVAAYNSNTPVKWIRIHNLPDHVYFNHSQHVKAGKLACENCHGKVQEMERVEQVSTLEMGWCVNCHREKNVDSNNPYYANTYDFVKKHKKYTVAQLGGLECSKCHY